MDWTWIIIKGLSDVGYQIKHSKTSKPVRINGDNLKLYHGSKLYHVLIMIMMIRNLMILVFCSQIISTTLSGNPCGNDRTKIYKKHS